MAKLSAKCLEKTGPVTLSAHISLGRKGKGGEQGVRSEDTTGPRLRGPAVFETEARVEATGHTPPFIPVSNSGPTTSSRFCTSKAPFYTSLQGEFWHNCQQKIAAISAVTCWGESARHEGGTPNWPAILLGATDCHKKNVQLKTKEPGASMHK